MAVQLGNITYNFTNPTSKAMDCYDVAEKLHAYGFKTDLLLICIIIVALLFFYFFSNKIENWVFKSVIVILIMTLLILIVLKFFGIA